MQKQNYAWQDLWNEFRLLDLQILKHIKALELTPRNKTDAPIPCPPGQHEGRLARRGVRELDSYLEYIKKKREQLDAHGTASISLNAFAGGPEESLFNYYLHPRDDRKTKKFVPQDGSTLNVPDKDLEALKSSIEEKQV